MSILLPNSRDMCNSIVDILEWKAMYEAKQIAYRFVTPKDTNDQTLTHAELAKEAKAVAVLLKKAKIKKGDRALLIYPPGLELVAAFYGCLYAGVIAVPMYPPTNVKIVNKIQKIIEDCHPAIILTTAAISKKLHNLKWLKKIAKVPFIKRPHWDKSLSLAQWDVDKLPILSTGLFSTLNTTHVYHANSIDANDIAFLQYTSGSTGNAKGVMVSHDNLMANLLDIVNAFEVTTKDICLSWLPPYHDMGLIGCILAPLYSGIEGILMSPLSFLQNPAYWLELISKQQKTVISGSPNFAYEYCCQKVPQKIIETLDLSHWRLAFNGAEPIRVDTVMEFCNIFKPAGFEKKYFYFCYGLAESTLIVSGSRSATWSVVSQADLANHCVNTVTENSADALPLVKLGRPTQNLQIVDPHTCELVQAGNIGEIWIHGRSVTRGYWQQEATNIDVFQAKIKGEPNHIHYMRTGDLGFMLNDELHITGRLKDLIIIHGVNYYPHDIEYSVSISHPAIRSNCVAAFSVSVDNQENLIIVAEVDIKQIVHFDELLKIVGEKVMKDHHISPYAVVFISPRTLPKTTSGKIRRSYTKELYIKNELDLLFHWKRDNKAITDNTHALPLQANENKSQQNNNDAQILQSLKHLMAQNLNLTLDKINEHESLSRYALNSLLVTEMITQLNEHYQLNAAPNVFYEHDTLDSLAKYLFIQSQPAKLNKLQFSNLTPQQLFNAPYQKIINWYAGFKQSKRTQNDIAIIGMSGQFPGSPTLEKLWTNLISKKSMIVCVPETRWNVLDSHTDTQSQWAGLLDNVEQFDADFFHISPKEASLMDPQQRLLLESVWQTIENASYTPSDLAQCSTGVFVGAASNDYAELIQHTEEISPYAATGNAHSILANRISYLLDLKGPSETIDTACSSSLVALHRAITAIEQGDCDLALVGGVNVILSHRLQKIFANAAMLSPDGKCYSFDKRANGYVRGEGVGVILLKPLTRALKDRDHIHGIIKGSAVNHGGQVSSLTVPNPRAQAAVVMKALKRAGVDSQTISYLETHGTGTPLGDPLEMEGLKIAFTSTKNKTKIRHKSCGIGTIKSNIGHLEAASGIAGVIKVLLSFKHQTLPPLVHFNELNPYIDLDKSSFYPIKEAQSWEKIHEHLPRRAGVHSFGFGGTNAHVILEEPTPVQQDASSQKAALIVLSAKSFSGLTRKISELNIFLHQHQSPIALADLSYTLCVGRHHFAFRLAFIVKNIAELKNKLQTISSAQSMESIREQSVLIAETDCAANKTIMDSHYKTMDYNEKLSAIAAAYVQGYAVKWQILFKEGDYSRVPLPTYPFEKKRFWLTKENNINTIYPLIDRYELALGSHQFYKTLHADAFYLHDHKIHGDSILPGVVFLEFIHQAYTLIQAKQHPIEIREVRWLTPLSVNQAYREICLTLKDHHVNIISADETLLRAEVFSLASESEIKRVDIDALKKIWIKLDNAKPYDRLAIAGLHYGVSFQTIQSMWVSDHAILTELKLLNTGRALRERWICFPSILDGALQSIIGFHLKSNEKLVDLKVPFTAECIRFYQRVHAENTYYAYVDQQPLDTYNILILDDEGHCHLEIKNLKLMNFQSTVISQKQPQNIKAYLLAQVSKVLALPEESIDGNKALNEYGMDSLAALQLMREISNGLGAEPTTILLKYNTLNKLTDYYLSKLPEQSPSFTSQQHQIKLLKVKHNADVNDGSLKNCCLSYIETWLYHLIAKNPTNKAYCVQYCLKIHGKLNVDHLNDAWQILIKRHAILRSLYLKDKGELRRSILPSIVWQLPLQKTDLHDLKNDIQRFFSHTFRPHAAPLWDVQLLKLAEQTYYLTVNFSHLIVDGWSVAILFNELASLYNSLSSDIPPRLPELTYQYEDFVEWQYQNTNPRILNYWQRIAKPACPITLGDKRNELPIADIGLQKYYSYPHLEKLNLIADASGLTLFHVMFSLYVYSLKQYANQQDVSVKLVIGNRSQAEFADCVGYFAHGVYFSMHVPENALTCLYKSHQILANRLKRGLVPFEWLYENNIFPSMTDGLACSFNMYNFPLKADFNALKVEFDLGNHVTIDYWGDRTDFAFIAHPKDDCVVFCIKYRNQLFSAESIDQFMDLYYCNIDRLYEEFVNRAALKVVNADNN